MNIWFARKFKVNDEKCWGCRILNYLPATPTMIHYIGIWKCFIELLVFFNFICISLSRFSVSVIVMWQYFILICDRYTGRVCTQRRISRKTIITSLFAAIYWKVLEDCIFWIIYKFQWNSSYKREFLSMSLERFHRIGEILISFPEKIYSVSQCRTWKSDVNFKY